MLIDGPGDAALTVVLAHGAGAPMDSPFMAFFAEGLAAAGYRCVRFEFPYMAMLRHGGAKRPPDTTEKLMASWREVIVRFDPARLVIGGKSLGGRMASLVADDAGVAGLVCLGYPFHPPGRPAQTRTAHLARLQTPTLIVQGRRDPFGGEAGWPATTSRPRSGSSGSRTATTASRRAPAPVCAGSTILPQPWRQLLPSCRIDSLPSGGLCRFGLVGTASAPCHRRGKRAAAEGKDRR